MNHTDLEEAITNRLRARIEAGQLDSEKPREPLTEASDGEAAVANVEVPRTVEAFKPAAAETVPNHVAVAGGVREAEASPEEVLKTVDPPLEDRHGPLGAELTQRLLEIKNSYSKLATDLGEALALLANRGVPFPFPVQNGLASTHREFLKLRRDVVAKLSPHHGGPIESQRIVGLADLEELIVRISGQAAQAARELPPVLAPLISEEPRPVPPAVAPPLETVAPVRTEAVPPQSTPAAPESLISRWSDDELNSPLLTPRVEKLNQEPITTPSEPAPPVAPEAITATRPAESSNDAGAILGEAEETIERILRIRVKPGKVLPEWEEALIAARALKRKVLTETDAKLSPETIALAKGLHPLAALLRLIEQTGQLGDVEWAELHAIVEDGLGKPIAMAAARHRFMLED